MRAVFWRTLDGVVDLAFPRSCVACASLVEGDRFRHLCERCAGQLSFVQGPACVTCGHPFFGASEVDHLCPHCEGLAPAFNRGKTALLCRGPARDLVHELKYHRGVYLRDDIEVIFRNCPSLIELARGAVLVPVPLHPRKLRERGFNQSAMIAEALLRAADGEARIETALVRDIDTQSQTAFDRRTRMANLKNAFALSPKAIINCTHHYILVDDVFTTGSTLNGCARVLRRAGALNLDVVTFGHG